MHSTQKGVLLFSLFVGICLVALGLFVPAASAAVSSKFPIEINVQDGGTVERVLFADHNSSVNGNWFNLSGGRPFVLPNPIRFQYDGVSSKTFTASGKTVTILSTFTKRVIVYPFDSHPLYYPGETVSTKFLSNGNYLGEKVILRFVNVNISEVVDAFNDALEGNLSSFKNIITQNTVWAVEKTIESHGTYIGFNHSWTQLQSGDFALIAYQINNIDPANTTYTVFGVTGVEVLEYGLNVNYVFNPFIQSFEMNASLVGGNPKAEYSFGAVLVRDSAYKLLANLTTDGTLNNTVVKVKTGLNPPITLVNNSKVLGYGLRDLLSLVKDKNLIIDTAKDLFAGDEVSYRYPEKVARIWDSFSMVVGEFDLSGEYYFIVGAWEHGTGNRLVGVYQKKITVLESHGVKVLTPIGKKLSEKAVVAGASVEHDFMVVNTGTVVDIFDISLAGDGASNVTTITLPPGGVGWFKITHNASNPGIYQSKVTVTSQRAPSTTTTVRAKTFAVSAGNHSTYALATGFHTINDTNTELLLDINLTSPAIVELFKLPGNPRTEKPHYYDYAFGYFIITVTNNTAVDWASVGYVYSQDTVDNLGLDETSISVKYWDETQWRTLTVTLWTDINQFMFDIPSTAWLTRSYDFDFVIGSGFEVFLPPPPAPPPPVPTPEIPENATEEEIVETLQEATEGLDPDLVDDVIEDATEGMPPEEVAEVVNQVVSNRPLEEIVIIVSQLVEDKPAEEAAVILREVGRNRTAGEKAKVLEEAVSRRNATETAKILKTVVEADDEDEAGDVILDIIEERPPEEKAEILIEQETEKAANAMTKANTTMVVEVIDVVVPEADLEEVEDPEVLEKVEKAAEILANVEEEKAAEALLETPSTVKSKNLVEKMAEVDLRAAAVRVEEVVKLRVRVEDEETRARYTTKIKEIVELGDPEKLAELFVEIANLPETPSTVAEIFEIISLNKTMEIVDIILEMEAYDELAEVYSYLSEAKLVEVYTAMTPAGRAAIYPYLDAKTISKLPVLTTFQIELSVTPEKVVSGTSVKASAKVENTGAEVGSLEVVLKVDSVEEARKTVVLQAGEEETLEWSITKTTPGTYTVDVNGRTATFTVEAPPKPAEFETSNLALSPASVKPGEDVSVSVQVENTGEESGSYTVEVELDGTLVDSQTVTLEGGESIELTFYVSSESEGTHTVQVDELTATFTVEKPPAAFPWTMVLGVVVVIAIIAAYYYTHQRK